MADKNSGQREKYVQPTEFKVGGDPPGGAVRRQRGRGGMPPEEAVRLAPRNVGVVTHEPGPPSISYKIPANLEALMADCRVSTGPSTIPDFNKNFATKVGPVAVAVQPQPGTVVRSKPPAREHPNYGPRFRGVLDQKERIKIWTQIFLEEEEKRSREKK